MNEDLFLSTSSSVGPKKEGHAALISDYLLLPLRTLGISWMKEHQARFQVLVNVKTSVAQSLIKPPFSRAIGVPL